MKNTFKAVLSAVLFLIPAFSLFSQTTGPRVPQTVADEYVNKGGLVYSKKTQGPNSAGEYTIFLKTFVTGTVTTEQVSIPSDIVLVLDVSGSMNESMNQNTQYVSAGRKNWSYQEIKNSTTQYYYKSNSNYYQVYAAEDYNAINYFTGRQVGNLAYNSLNAELYTIKDTRLDALKEAVEYFINQIAADATEHGYDNNIAIVKFSSNTYAPKQDDEDAKVTDETSMAEGDDSFADIKQGYIPNWHANYTQIVKGFKSATSSKAELISAVNGLHASGATAADFGMRKAELLIKSLYNKKDDETNELVPQRTSNKIVVLFTDGDPTYVSSFDPSVATKTIVTAKKIKDLTAFDDESTGKSSTAKVYTIGTFSGTPNQNTTGRYMQRVSSNYPYATGMADDQGGSGSDNGGYYFLADNKEKLIDAFETIGSDAASASIDLGSSATAVDVVSQSFDIPYVVDSEGNINTDVKVWKAPLSNITTGSDNKPVYTFPTTNLQPATEVKLVVAPQTGTVSATGFDYTANACAMVNGRPIGNQLIIEIPIKMDDNAVGGHGVATNGPGSGIRYKEKQEDGSYVDKLITFDTPAINLPTNLEIKKEGLQEGESARFRIQRRAVDSTGAWEDYSTVFITNKKTNEGFSKDGTVKIIGLHPDYVYRIIEEEGWSWSYGGTTVTGLRYDPNTGDRTTVTDMTNGTAANNWNDNTVTSDKVNLNPITFTNKKKAVQVRHAESIVINDFKGASADAQAGHTENSKEQPK